MAYNAEYKPYTVKGYSWMRATGTASFLRTCIIWQVFKFAYYNLKILMVLNDMEKHH
jgi:hypothetical protein